MIYVVEDDNSIAELLEIALKSNSYEVLLFEKAEDVINELNNNEKSLPNLIICDVMLPQMNGISAVSEIKKIDAFKKIPIILLTAKDSELDKIKGLDAGADDYITKPFSVMELMARVRVQLRKNEARIDNFNTSKKLSLGSIGLDIETREVGVDNENIELTFKEFELLKYMIENKNKSISRDELLNKIWGYDYSGETRTIDIHIKTLRKKLLSGEKYIKTIRGIGYKISEK